MHAGAAVNAKDHRMQTPLHVAASKGEQRVMKFLLEKKADAMAKDLDGNTPVDLAVTKDEDLVLTHLEHADIENDNSVKRTLEDVMTSGSNISDDEVSEKFWELSPLRYAARLILFFFHYRWIHILVCSVLKMFRPECCGGEGKFNFLRQFVQNPMLKVMLS